MDQEVFDFIQKNKEKSIPDLALLLSKKNDLPKEYILRQISGKQKAKKKLPFLLLADIFEYPSIKAVEQSSSELTAKHKAQLFQGIKLIDLSGGMGIDSYFFSQQYKEVHYVEQDEGLCELSQRNFKEALSASTIQTHHSSAVDFIRNFQESVDLVYLDPDRRVTNNRAFLIDDCEPNVAELLPKIWEISSQCLIKLSPMLDINQALTQLENCKDVYVISLNNECKELLFLLEKGWREEAQIIVKEIGEQHAFEFQFTFSKELIAKVEFSEPLQYLYEPNASLMKSGAFKLISQKFGVKKLGVNTHLYTSQDLVDDFPGRTLVIKSVTKPKKGLVKKANVVVRNFPLSSVELKKKYKVNDGGIEFLYACSLENDEKVFLLCERIG